VNLERKDPSRPSETSCFICSNSSGKILEKDGYFHFLCYDCGHIKVTPTPSQEFLNLLYDSNYEYTSCERSSSSIQKSYGWIDKLETSKEYNILDVGCADGVWLDYLKNMGFKNLFGIEISFQLSEIARLKGYQIVNGDLSRNFFEDQTFDLIHIGDVIEHMIDPAAMLSQLKNLLTRDGYIVITTPNMDSLWSKITRLTSEVTGLPWSSLTPPHHQQNFTQKSLKLLIENLGFRVVSKYTSSHSIFYELGSLHLRRNFLKNKNVFNLFRLLMGYGLYLLCHLLCLILLPIFGEKFKLTFVIENSIGSTETYNLAQ
jgi:2-polyprenyl-3-methyl-5-hydroxy-6-metoxy-1,4-benzoquinol methylase